MKQLGFEKIYFGQELVMGSSFPRTSFLSILSMSFEFSIGHAFHLFKLIFSVVTSFVLLSDKKISKIKKKKSKNPKKTTTTPK